MHVDGETAYQVPTVANFSGIDAGAEFGYQWVLWRRVVIQYYLLDGRAGHLSGTLSSHKDLSYLTAGQKAELKDQLESLYNVAGVKYLTANVTDQGVQGKLSGLFFGVKSGILIGVAF